MACDTGLSRTQERRGFRLVKPSNSEAVLATIDAFISVGADRFTVSRVGIGKGGNSPDKLASADQVRRTLPGIVADATAREQSVIIRPYSDRTAFVQLDDIDREKVADLASLSVGFIALRTSLDSYQVWIALESQGHDADLDFARRLQYGNCADENANGATRCGGSRNFQEKHRANGFPLVRVRTHPGRINTREQLEALGIVGPEIMREIAPQRVEQSTGDEKATQWTTSGAWPSYKVALQRARRKANGKPDRSDADLAFAMTALSWGRPSHEIEERLNTESERIAEIRAERGDKAADREVTNTVKTARRFVQRNAA